MSIATLIFFALAFVSVFFMRLFRMGTLLAFLLTGVLAGQHVFGLFELSGEYFFSIVYTGKRILPVEIRAYTFGILTC